MDAVSWSNFYELLWNTRHLKLKVNIPDTLVLKDGQATLWFFTSKDGLVLRRNKETTTLDEFRSRLHTLAAKGKTQTACVVRNENRTPQVLQRGEVDAALDALKAMTINEDCDSQLQGTHCLQSYVEPASNVRYVCCYFRSETRNVAPMSECLTSWYSEHYDIPSDRVSALGSSDVTLRQIHQPRHAPPTMSDSCRSELRRNTLSIVFYMQEAHGLIVDALDAEFVFSRRGKLFFTAVNAVRWCPQATPIPGFCHLGSSFPASGGSPGRAKRDSDAAKMSRIPHTKEASHAAVAAGRDANTRTSSPQKSLGVGRVRARARPQSATPQRERVAPQMKPRPQSATLHRREDVSLYDIPVSKSPTGDESVIVEEDASEGEVEPEVVHTKQQLQDRKFARMSAGKPTHTPRRLMEEMQQAGQRVNPSSLASRDSERPALNESSILTNGENDRSVFNGSSSFLQPASRSFQATQSQGMEPPFLDLDCRSKVVARTNVPEENSKQFLKRMTLGRTNKPNVVQDLLVQIEELRREKRLLLTRAEVAERRLSELQEFSKETEQKQAQMNETTSTFARHLEQQAALLTELRGEMVAQKEQHTQHIIEHERRLAESQSLLAEARNELATYKSRSDDGARQMIDAQEQLLKKLKEEEQRREDAETQRAGMQAMLAHAASRLEQAQHEAKEALAVADQEKESMAVMSTLLGVHNTKQMMDLHKALTELFRAADLLKVLEKQGGLSPELKAMNARVRQFLNQSTLKEKELEQLQRRMFPNERVNFASKAFSKRGSVLPADEVKVLASVEDSPAPSLPSRSSNPDKEPSTPLDDTLDRISMMPRRDEHRIEASRRKGQGKQSVSLDHQVGQPLTARTGKKSLSSNTSSPRTPHQAIATSRRRSPHEHSSTDGGGGSAGRSSRGGAHSNDGGGGGGGDVVSPTKRTTRAPPATTSAAAAVTTVLMPDAPADVVSSTTTRAASIDAPSYHSPSSPSQQRGQISASGAGQRGGPALGAGQRGDPQRGDLQRGGPASGAGQRGGSASSLSSKQPASSGGGSGGGGGDARQAGKHHAASTTTSSTRRSTSPVPGSREVSSKPSKASTTTTTVSPTSRSASKPLLVVQAAPSASAGEGRRSPNTLGAGASTDGRRSPSTTTSLLRRTSSRSSNSVSPHSPSVAKSPSNSLTPSRRRSLTIKEQRPRDTGLNLSSWRVEDGEDEGDHDGDLPSLSAGLTSGGSYDDPFRTEMRLRLVPDNNEDDEYQSSSGGRTRAWARGNTWSGGESDGGDGGGNTSGGDSESGTT